jgi:Bacterial membrane protein YfhO
VIGGKYFLAFRDPAVASGPLLDLLSVEWVAADVPLVLGRYPVASGAVGLFHNPGFLPRFRVVRRAEAYDDVAAARSRLLSPLFDPRGVALVPVSQVAAVAIAGPAAAVAVAEATVAVRRYEPQVIELDVDAPAAGVLVTSEAAYPGWRSRIDGQPVDTLLVNTAFRGVAVPAGRHHVTMEYVPWSFRAGLLLSGVAAGVMLLAGLRRW